MARLPASMQPHTATVREKAGVTGTGTLYGPSETVACRIDDTVRLVRGTDGNQVVSSTTVYTSDQRDLWSPGSIVTVNGRDTTVITVSRHDDGGAGGWQHTEIALV